MSFLAPSPPPLPALPAAPPPAPSFGMQPGQKPQPKLQQSTFIPGGAFPSAGQTQGATLMGGGTGGKSLLGT